MSDLFDLDGNPIIEPVTPLSKRVFEMMREIMLSPRQLRYADVRDVYGKSPDTEVTLVMIKCRELKAESQLTFDASNLLLRGKNDESDITTSVTGRGNDSVGPDDNG